MHYNLYTLPIEKESKKGENTWLEEGFKMTDDLLKWCADNKMYLISIFMQHRADREMM
jgi:hypothetical protein